MPEEQEVEASRRRVIGLTFVWAAISPAIAGTYALPVGVAGVAFVLSGWSLLRESPGAAGLALALAAVLGLAFYGVAVVTTRGVRSVLRWPDFPAEHWRRASKELATAIAFELGAAAVTVGLTIYAIWGRGRYAESAVGLATIAHVILLLQFLPNVVGIGDVLSQGHVIPYFDRQVGEIDTYCHGKVLARHLAGLDESAAAAGLTPLSRFGWNDDMRGEPLIWHEALAGLKTTKALLASLRDSDLAIPEHEGVVADLERLAHALARADAAGIRFCLLLSYATGTSGLEWERRRGTCF